MRLLLILVMGIAAWGCGGDGNGGTGGSGGDDSLDLDIGPGEVRAGRLSADQLPDDPNGLALWEVDDFALVNEHIALIIEDAGDSDLYLPFGGSIVGVTRYEDGALVDRADFAEFAIGLRRFLVAAETVSLINDGTDGNPAVVRAEGPLRAIPFTEDLLSYGPNDPTVFGGILLGGPPPNDETYQSTRVQVDFELAPRAEHLDVYYTVDTALINTKPTYMIIQSKRMDPYVPGQGFGTGDLTLDYDYMAFADDNAVSYAIEDVSGPMQSAFKTASSLISDPEVSGLLPLSRVVPIEFEPRKIEHFMRMHVGGPGIDGLLQAMARTKGESTRPITGTVQNADETPAEGVRVHAQTTDATPVYLTRSAITDADGSYSVSVPEGQEVQLVAYKRGDGFSDPPVVVEASSTSANLTMPQKGAIQVTATDALSMPLPVRVQVIAPVGDADQPPDNFGEPIVPQDSRLHVVFPTNGQTLLSVPPGDHRVVVSRGYEYDIFDEIVRVDAGAEPSEVNAQLTRVVESPGVLCGDFHIHTHRSVDAVDSPEFKLMAAAGDGVELPVRTDHEFVAEFEPVVASLGLEAWMYGFTALELTTSSFGHFGVFPLEPDTNLPNDGAILWNGIDEESGTVEIFDPVPVLDDARSRPGDPEVIIFHPRPRPGDSGSFSALIGENYFSGTNGFTNAGGVDYDPETDMIQRDVDRDKWWDRKFRVVEAFNDGSFAEYKQNNERIWDGENLSTEIGNVDDWFGLLNSADRPDGVFVVGSSDSHIIMNDSPVGYPRTCVLVGTDDPETLRARPNPPQEMKELIRTGKSVISGGIYILPTGMDMGPGDTITGAGPYQIPLEVQAPLWVGDVVLLEMWTSSNGEITSTPIPDPEINPDLEINNLLVRRFSDSVTVPAGTDWVVFHARGAFDPKIENRSDQEQTLDPVHPGRLPFGVTNPIFFAP